eukprot:PhM_4_TR14061/c0_g1_i1/m.9979
MDHFRDRFDKGKTALENAARETSDKTKALLEEGRGAVEKTKELLDRVEIPDEIRQAVMEKTRMLEHKLEEFAEEKKMLLKKIAEERANVLRVWMVSRLERLLDHLLTMGSDLTKETLKDPDMPVVVQGWVDSSVDILWPDVVSEVKSAVLTGFLPPLKLGIGQPPDSCFGRFIAYLRYNLMPYDHSIWYQLKNPPYIIYRIIGLIPFFGVPQALYVFTLMLLDRGDEFMMMTFILEFKVVQFVTLGVLSTIIGAAQFYLCTIREHNDCLNSGPRQELYELGTFCLQVLLVWAAFYFLRTAESKGGYFHQYQREKDVLGKNNNKPLEQRNKMLSDLLSLDNDEVPADVARILARAESAHSGHTRLMLFLIYDICLFGLCLVLGIWSTVQNLYDEEATATEGGWDNWKLRMTWFWIKTLYGLLSFPFVVLSLPVIVTLLTHAKPTAFNKFGNTVPYIGRIPPDEDAISDEDRHAQSLDAWARQKGESTDLNGSGDSVVEMS